ncbi:MAG: hypothetical protein JRI68_12985 [Deltaproteobacteria bacterium]|nr:hypothetical protein [Deltaproteobacteria bacterium]
MPGDDQARFVAVDEDLAVATPPWQDGAPPEPAEGRQAEVVVAADARGMVAALAYCPDPGGVLVTELELRLAGDGPPVRRGIPRVTPATPCPAPLPIALLRRSAPRWFAALGVGGARVIRADDLAGGSDQLATQLERLKDVTAGSTALAASVLRRQTAVARV